MADDIDIEEHDVLESLRRRQQPDTSIVKSEPVDIEYEEPNYEDPDNYEWEWEKDKVEIKVEPHTDEFRFGKIILGSKPAGVPDDDPETPGSSQGAQSVSEDYNYNMALVLEDWGPILESNSCYCKSCGTLFATVNALDAHKMLAHSFLVATDKQPSPERNKAIKSTAKPSSTDHSVNTCQICHHQFKGTKSNLFRHYRNVHQVDPNATKSDFKSWRVCNHCNLYFPDDTSLVKHLYELLPINDLTPSKGDKTVRSEASEKIVSKTVKASKSLNVKQVATIKKEASSTNVQPNKIILGSKPMAVKTESVNEDPNKMTCEICSIEYVKKYYLQHMRKFHSDFLLKKQKQPVKIILSDSKVRYKCQICSELFTTMYAVKKHRAKHPGMKRKRLFVKLVNKIKAKPVILNVVKKEPIKVYQRKVKKEAVDEIKVLVSKSTLFKCNRCSVHFLTCTGACQHSIVCETSSNIRDWACPQCQRVFKSTDKTAHEYQHKMLKGSTFKVYVVYLEMIVRILCQCPNCSVCFEEDKFWTHVNGGCKDAASYFCKECKLPIDIHAKANHDSKHKQGDFTKEDFIKIEYISSKMEVPIKIKTEVVEDVKSPVLMKVELDEIRRGLKRKLEVPVNVTVPRKRRKNVDELLLFYCQFCKSFLGKKTDGHLSGDCRLNTKANRAFCNHCGIYLKYKCHATHMPLHTKIPNLTIADFTFVKVTDSKKIKPVQQLCECKTCKVNFVNIVTQRTHKCGRTPSRNCQICQKKIEKEFFQTHLQIHNYVIPKQVKTISNMMQTLENPDHTESPKKTPKTAKNLNEELPDLMMKYQSLTALWNILYLCAICDTFTDSYDKVVDHCQNHLTNMENYGVVIKKCEKCDMKFESECYKRHLELHAGNKVISQSTFQILKYEPYELFSETWFDFIDLPEDQKSQIVRRSIYRQNRCVKMKLSQQGPPEYTLYKCEKCSNCVAVDNIVYHVKLANCLKAHKIQCSICNMTYAIKRDCEEHEKIHETTGLGLHSFRIVSFNNASDAEANITIMSYDTEDHGSKSKISFTDDEPKPTKESRKTAPVKSFVFYQCAECLTCVAHFRNFPKHACNNSTKRQCNECGIHSSIKYISRHQLLHRKYNFSRKNVIIKTLNKHGKVINIKKQSATGPTQNKVEDPEQKSKLYKCFCGLHYTSLKSIEKHYKLKNCSTVIREKCSQCNLVFDPIEVVNHLCKHHAQNQVHSFTIVTPNKKTLYKCGNCHVLFYNRALAILHKSSCVGKIASSKCEKCGLAFDVTSLSTHMVDHERNNKLKNDCYIIVKIPDEKPKTAAVDKVIDPYTLYKCKTCDIHFMRRSSARNHITKRTDCGTTVAANCGICERKFPVKSINKHVAWQHSKLMNKAFHVIELTLGVNTKLPKYKQKDAKHKVKKEEVIPKKEQVNVTVYRCKKCLLLFNDESTLLTHLEDRCSKELTEECDECNAKFPAKIINEHNKLHAAGAVISMTIVEDIQISDDVTTKTKVHRVPCEPKDPLDRYDNKLFKCTICNMHYLTFRSLESHREKDRQTCNPDLGVNCDECDIPFTSYSLKRHKLIHEKYNFKKEDFVIYTLADAAKLTAAKTTEVRQESTGKYDNRLYKCTFCNLHFLTRTTAIKHDNCNPDIGVKCEECDISFTAYSLRRHKLIHETHNLKKEDFTIVTVADVQPETDDVKTESKVNAKYKQKKELLTKYDNKLYKCTLCNLHYLTHATLLKHIDCNPNVGVQCDECNITFTTYSLTRHKAIHEKFKFKKEDFVILTLADIDKSSQGSVNIEHEDLNSSSETETLEEPKKDSTPNLHFLYKCVECNVYYTTRVSCHKHITNHTPLDPKDYIECKLCGFQFTIMGLPAHIKKHHDKPLKLEEIRVEEYRENNVKSFETYLASEKDQSTLVSTSEDVRNSSVVDDNDCVVSSCNDEIDSSDIQDVTGEKIADSNEDSDVVESSENNAIVEIGDDKTNFIDV